MKEFLHRKQTQRVPNITPLMDVMFMLLLFFMITSSFIKPSIALKLPEASNTEKIEKQQIMISVIDNDRVFVNKTEVALEELSSTLQRELKHSAEKKIVFRGDENILYKHFVKVMGIIKESGAKEINIAHESENM